MVQGTLFDEPLTSVAIPNYLEVPGLCYRPDLLSSEEQEALLAEVDTRPWLGELKRRVQHYGYKYDYKARSIDSSMFVGPLPGFAVQVAERLVREGLYPEMPDQLIVNEYTPGQGISAHVDCEPCFKGTIATVSLGWSYEMEFISMVTAERKTVMLEVGSVLVMTGEARHVWTHGIRARGSDRGVRRKRRVSLTFRNVILPPGSDAAS